MMHTLLRRFEARYRSTSAGKGSMCFSKNGVMGLMVAAFMALALLSACSGDGSSSNDSGSVDALSMPDRITMTQVEDAGAGASAVSAAANPLEVGIAAYNDPGSDYSEQTKDTWVEDTDALNLINDILGVVSDTAYDQFLNAGPYKALVRKVDDSVETQSGASSTSSTTESLMEITVDVTREDNTSPMIVKVWVDESGDGDGAPAQRIRGYFEVDEGVSDAYPLGRMEAHFKANLLDGNGDEIAGDPVFTMALSVDADQDGNVTVESVDIGDIAVGPMQERWDNQLNLIANADLSVGQAYFSESEYWTDGSGTYEDDLEGYVAYNSDFFKEREGTDPEETFDKNSLFRKVYRYKLFDADTGNAIQMTSGFPISTANDDYGYIGYYGLWIEHGVEVQDGDMVTDMPGNSYEVFKVAGKLRKHTKASIPLGELTDVEMSYYECAGSCTDYVIAWDGVEFLKLGARNTQTGQIDYLDTPVPFVFPDEWSGAWCQALNAYLTLGRYTTPDNNTEISYHAEETIDPAAAENLTLYYWGPPLGMTHEAYWEGTVTEKTYSFDRLSMVLNNEVDEPILDTVSETGTTISPLTLGSLPVAEMWDAYDQDVYYSWTTGPNEWQQFTTLIDADQNFMTFDPPLHFAYTHTLANDLNGSAVHSGKKFSLEYDGFELRVPWNFDPEEEEWQPVINLKDGTLLTHDSTQYVVKGTEIGVMMQLAADPSAADGLILDTTIPAPSLAYDASKTDLVGAVPAAVLEVIKGELVD